MKKLSLHHILSLCFALFILTGCDSNDPDDPETIVGSFEIQITGDVTQNISGNQASFGAATDPQTGLTGFGLAMGATGGTSQSLTVSRKGARPGNGNHTIADFSLDTDLDTINDNTFIVVYSTGTDVFYSSGGTLSISSSSDRNLEGSINLTARSVLPNSTDEITITGSFTAVGLDLSNQ